MQRAPRSGHVAAAAQEPVWDLGDIDAALREMLLDGSLDMELFDARIARTLLTRFRLGEFDSHNPANPSARVYDETQLDGPAHRALARRANRTWRRCSRSTRRHSTVCWST